MAFTFDGLGCVGQKDRQNHHQLGQIAPGLRDITGQVGLYMDGRVKGVLEQGQGVAHENTQRNVLDLIFSSSGVCKQLARQLRHSVGRFLYRGNIVRRHLILWHLQFE
ncbi:MAG: hypothetical protein R6V60_19500, partial [Desulfobacterales bacterium]